MELFIYSTSLRYRVFSASEFVIPYNIHVVVEVEVKSIDRSRGQVKPNGSLQSDIRGFPYRTLVVDREKNGSAGLITSSSSCWHNAVNKVLYYCAVRDYRRLHWSLADSSVYMLQI